MRPLKSTSLPIGMHAGSTYRVAPTAAGWPSYRVEDYVAYASGFREPDRQHGRGGRVLEISAI